MRTLRNAMMCGVAAATMLIGLPALAQDQTPDQTQSQTQDQMQARECSKNLQAYNQQVMNQKTDYRTTIMPRLQSTLRQLRTSALILERAGEIDACKAVVAAIQDIAANPGEAENNGAVDYEAWRTSEKSRLENARSLSDLQSQIRAEDLIGADVRNYQNQNLGEVDDLLLGMGKNEPSYVIVSNGGFLGIGAKQVAIPMDQVKITADRDVLVLDMSENQLADAPSFKRGDYTLLRNEKWRQKNRAYFTQIAQSPDKSMNQGALDNNANMENADRSDQNEEAGSDSSQ